jgi:hypothetical protein
MLAKANPGTKNINNIFKHNKLDQFSPKRNISNLFQFFTSFIYNYHEKCWPTQESNTPKTDSKHNKLDRFHKQTFKILSKDFNSYINYYRKKLIRSLPKN